MFMVDSLQEASCLCLLEERLNPVRRIPERFASQRFCLAMNPSEPPECPTSLKWSEWGLAVAWGPILARNGKFVVGLITNTGVVFCGFPVAKDILCQGISVCLQSLHPRLQSLLVSWRWKIYNSCHDWGLPILVASVLGTKLMAPLRFSSRNSGR